MPVKQLREFLDRNNVKYVTMIHSASFTAQEIAAAAHVPGKELAKTVVLKLDGGMAMAVLPASFRVDLDLLKRAVGFKTVELATEDDFRDRFPGCDVGAMPPFGNLFDMPVYVAETLAEDDEIVFNAGSHTELIRLSYRDFERLVQPTVLAFTAHV